MIRARVLATACATLCSLGGLAAASPFKATLSGFPHSTPIDACHIRNQPTAEGFATHLGYVRYEADEIVDVCVPPGTPIVADATFTLTAADGDVVNGTLHVTAFIDYATFTAHSIGEYIFVSGTGRFADVSGTGTWEIFFPSIDPASTEPAQVSADGTIDY